MPASFSEQRNAALRKEAILVIADKVMPAYARLGKFFDTGYLPKARTTIGLADRPDGKAYYIFWSPTTPPSA